MTGVRLAGIHFRRLNNDRYSYCRKYRYEAILKVIDSICCPSLVSGTIEEARA